MPQTGETWRLGHRPALDGLRGVAVLLVVASHLVAGDPLHALGPAGVTVFFTLSGFLITALLLEERERTGRIDLRAFYRRRALRLAPALVALVAATALVGVLIGGGFVSWALVLGAVTYSSNWLEAAGRGAGSGLAHTWSLSVEEQFYLLWPITLVALSHFRRHWLISVLVAGMLTSAVARLAIAGDGWQRVYFGFDTHADALLVGCLLAALLHHQPTRRSQPQLVVAALACIVLAAFGGFAFVLLLLPSVVAAATAVAIFHAAQDVEVGWLSCRTLTLVGRRSYGLYLWHWPVFLLANRFLNRPGPLALLLVALPAAWGMTVLSWRFIETPFLRLKDRGQASAPAGRRYQSDPSATHSLN